MTHLAKLAALGGKDCFGKPFCDSCGLIRLDVRLSSPLCEHSLACTIRWLEWGKSVSPTLPSITALCVPSTPAVPISPIPARRSWIIRREIEI